MSSPANEPQDNSIEIGQILNQRFQIIELLGAGGMSLVYKALDLRQQEMNEEDPFIALKILKPNLQHHPELWTLLGQEAKKSQTLSHPNIVNVFDYDKSNDIAYMTMALLKGKSLELLLKHDALPQNLQLRLSISCQIIEALLYAHQQGVIHADLKPSNIFIELNSAADQAKVTLFDFGIARAVQGSSHRESKKTFSAFSPSYATPETLKGGVSGVKDDAYALGCVIYSVLTGVHPFSKQRSDQIEDPLKKLKKIPGLNVRQWHALKQILIFPLTQKASEPNIQVLLNRLQTAFSDQFQFDFKKVTLSLGLVLVAITLVIMLLMPDPYAQNNQINTLVETQQWQDIYNTLSTASRETQPINLSDHQRNQIIEGTLVQYNLYMDYKSNQYNPSKAKILLDIAISQFPDSQSMMNLEAGFQQRLSSNMNEMTFQLVKAMDEGIFCSQKISCTSGIVYWGKLLEQHHPVVYEKLKSQLLQSFIKFYALAHYQNQNQQASAIEEKALLFFEKNQLEKLGFGRTDMHQAEMKSTQATGLPKSSVDLKKGLQLIQNALSKNENLQGKWQSIFNYMVAFQVLTPGSNHFWSRQSISSSFSDYFKDEYGIDWRQQQKKSMETQSIDPCFQFGKTAFACQDSFPEGKGPALVSLWIDNAVHEYRLAISQYELSWNNLAGYCKEKECSHKSTFDAHPVYQMPQDMLEDYLNWLRQKTGFEYRLMTLEEWQILADPLGLLKEFISLDTRTQAPSCRKLGYENDAEFLKNVQVNQGSYDRNGLYNLVDLAPEIVTDGMKRVLVPGRRERLRRCRIDASPYEYPYTAYRVVRVVHSSR